jgi:hypothetical protein
MPRSDDERVPQRGDLFPFKLRSGLRGAGRDSRAARTAVVLGDLGSLAASRHDFESAEAHIRRSVLRRATIRAAESTFQKSSARYRVRHRQRCREPAMPAAIGRG